MQEFLGLLLLCCFFFSSDLRAETEYELSPVVTLGTPGTIFAEDPIVPASDGDTLLTSGTGSVQNALQDQSGLPVTNLGQPGNQGQVRGLGASAEDVDVQAFGISLNPPQGLGFDLSVFPQFLWSSYRYQHGPPLNSLNQSAATGTLSLVPWTLQALSEPGSAGQVAEFYSSLRLNQLSVGAKSGSQLAVVAGYSSVKVVGPSGGLSSRWEKGNYRGSFHLLASDLDAETPGSASYLTPNARTQNARFIPILQNDFRFSKNELLKTSLFYDASFLKYSNPDDSSFSRTEVRQYGIESAYLMNIGKFGLNYRQVQFISDSSRVPTQNIGNVQFSKDLRFGSYLLEPTVQGIWVTSYGFLPQGSAGLKKEWDQGRQALFTRVTFSRRIPSLSDRYSTYSGNFDQNFVGNPDLKVETDWTAILGWEGKVKSVEGSVQTYAQLKQNPRILTGTTVTNLHDASIFSLMGNGIVHVDSHFEVFENLILADSNIAAARSAFPYVPTVTNLMGFKVHSKSWELSAVSRLVSSRVYSIMRTNRLPGYAVLDLSSSFKIGGGISLAGRIENLFDRSIEITQGYPIGRNASLLLMGQI